MLQNSIIKPSFYLYAKRRSATQKDACIFLRITYFEAKVERSLCIHIDYDNWDKKQKKIKNSPLHEYQLEQVYNDTKEKVMGAFYLLSKSEQPITLNEIIDLSLNDKKIKTYTVLSVFSQELLKMEKKLVKPRQESNLLKHTTCKKHLTAFILKYYKANDITFNRINRKFIDSFEDFLMTV